MVDEQKIRLMTKLARYESEEGAKELRIVTYRRNGYIGIGVLKNFILTTIGYLLIWGVIIAYNMDYLLDNLHKVKLSVVLVEFIVGYLVFLIIYTFITYISRFRRYQKARENVRMYYAGLSELHAKFYSEEAKERKESDSR